MEALKQEIERALEERVRPRLRLHGGGVEMTALRDGRVRVRLTGACSGCPSAALTTRQLVEEELCAAVPWVRAVELEQGVSGALREEARRLLRARRPPLRVMARRLRQGEPRR